MNTINHPPYPLANGRKLQRKNHNGGHSPLEGSWRGELEEIKKTNFKLQTK
jgi:hypothetical protein